MKKTPLWQLKNAEEVWASSALLLQYLWLFFATRDVGKPKAAPRVHRDLPVDEEDGVIPELDGHSAYTSYTLNTSETPSPLSAPASPMPEERSLISNASTGLCRRMSG